MKPVEVAADLLGVKPEVLREYEERDPFNDTLVTGAICTQQDKNYGALCITAVDGHPLPPQVIYCTPKIHYPFDKRGVYEFPPTDRVLSFDKLDGTNVYGFSYRGPGKKWYTSFKTRLMPFMGDRRNGPFLSMWRELMAEYPMIRHLPAGGIGVSFEMYGYRNPHLIKYEEALDCAILFFVNQTTGALVPPMPFMDEHDGYPPTVPLEADIKNPHDLHAYYRTVEEQKQLELTRHDDEMFSGSEGSIWWVTSCGEWVPFKCKPADIKAIHFASGGPDTVSILHAAYRALEDLPAERALHEDDVIKILAEDFTKEVVYKKQLSIQNAVLKLNDDARLAELVKQRYDEVTGIYGGCTAMSFVDPQERRLIMRELSRFFPPQDMTRVYGALLRQFGVR